MTSDIATWDDDRLLAELRWALERNMPVPPAVDEFATEVFDLADVARHVAELVFDSRETERAGVRSAPSAASREMSFRAPGVKIEVVVLAEGVRHLVGQLIPPQTAKVKLLWRDEDRIAEADSLGRFTFEDVPAGAFSLRCQLDDDSSTVIQTEWTVI